MDKIFNINLNGQNYEIQDRPLTEQVATLEGEVAGKLDASAYTAYDDTQVKADIQANTTAIEGKQDKGNYALQGDSYTKAESDAKYLTEHQSLTAYAKTADVNTELAKKQDKGDYALKSEIPSVEGLASETYVSNKIKEVVGTAPEALDTLGEIADKLSGDDDAIAAINQVLDGKVSKDEYNTNQQSINNSLTDLSNNKADKTALNNKQDTLVSGTNIKTVNGSSLLGSGNLSVSVDELEADKVKFITPYDRIVQGEEITNGGNYEHVQYMIFTNGAYGEGLTLSWDGGYSIHYSAFYKNVTFTNVEGTYEKYGEGEYVDDFIVKLNTAIPLNNVSISYDSAMSDGDSHAYIATLEQEVKVETLPEVITNYYTKTEIDNMVGDINNALNQI